MYAKTKTAVAEILERTAEHLEWGRPRKRPGKPRPTDDGYCRSLPEAFRIACKQAKATKTAKFHAACAVYVTVYTDYPGWACRMIREGNHSYTGFLRRYDEEECDTREVIRTLRRAKRHLTS